MLKATNVLQIYLQPCGKVSQKAFPAFVTIISNSFGIIFFI